MKLIVSFFLVLNAIGAFSIRAMDPPQKQPTADFPTGVFSPVERMRQILTNAKTRRAALQFAKLKHFTEGVAFLGIYFLNEERLESDYALYLLDKIAVDNVIYELLSLTDVLQLAQKDDRKNINVNFKKDTQEILSACSKNIVIDLLSKDRDRLTEVINKKMPFKDFYPLLISIVQVQSVAVSHALVPGWEKLVPVDENISCLCGRFE